MNVGKEIRLKRIWKKERAVIIPYDHGQYGGVPTGLEDPLALTKRIAATDADAVLVTPAVLKRVAPSLGDLGTILRLDGGFTKYSPILDDYQPVSSVEHALQLGADAGIVLTFVGTSFDAASLARLGAAAEQSDKWGLPLVSEILPPCILSNHFERDLGMKSAIADDIHQQTQLVARVAVEHGADIVKTRFSGSIPEFRKVVETCGGRVIVAGGPNLQNGDDGLLVFASDCMQTGAQGIIFGRNVWQHPKMEKMIEALCAIVHDDVSVSAAKRLLQ